MRLIASISVEFWILGLSFFLSLRISVCMILFLPIAPLIIILLLLVMRGFWVYAVSYQVALVVKNLPGNAGEVRHVGSIPELGGSPGEGYGNPLQSSCLKNHMDRGAWWATVHGVAKSQTRLKLLSTHACTDICYKVWGGYPRTALSMVPGPWYVCHRWQLLAFLIMLVRTPTLL